MILTLAAMLQLAPAASAQIEPRELLRPIVDLPGDFRREVDLEGLLTLGVSGGATLVARPDDNQVHDAVLSSRPLGADGSAAASWAGDGLVLAPGSALFYLGGLYWDSPGARRFGEMGLEALAVSALETQALKLAVRRERPDKADRYSFPSGHASASFAVAAAAAEEWGWAGGVPAYLAAAVISLSRLERNKHYLSDVVFGAGLGIASGRAVARAHRAKEGASARLLPLPGGAALVVRF